MTSRRKNLKRASGENSICLKEGESIMQVVSLRGSNLIEVLDAKGIKSLAFFPAKFQKSFWIKRGSYLVVDASGRDQALGSGSKVACVVSQVLFHDQVRVVEKSTEWYDTTEPSTRKIEFFKVLLDKKPSIFKNSSVENDLCTKSSSNSVLSSNVQQSRYEDCEEESGSDEEDDDGLPPLEANTNRNRPFELYSESESDS